jgi:HK97 family phage major capsid protein/HK97 family phage prohead protease
MHIVRKATTATVDGSLEYVLSDATIDRYGDTIDASGWDLRTFTTNPIALFNHDSKFPIGRWENVRVERGALKGKLVLAEEGTSARIDEVIRLARQGILRAVSVGFTPVEQEPLPKKGIRYKRAELMETSLVSIPANPNALQIAKALHVSDDTQAIVFGGDADRDDGVMRRGIHGEHAATSLPRKSRPMETPTLSKRIEFAQARLVTLRDDAEQLIFDGGDTPDEVNLTAREEKNREIDLAERNLSSLEQSEQLLAARAVRVIEHEPQQRSSEFRRPFAAPAEKVRDGEYFMRTLIGTVVARARGWRPNFDSPDPLFQVLAERYGEDGKIDEKTRAIAAMVCRSDSEHCNPLEVFQRVFSSNAMVQRTATAPATTTTSGWASQLVATGYADFLQLLLPNSVFPGLAARSMRLTFGRNGIISIPSRVATPTIAGSFVAEGAPIPVRQGAVTSLTFTPKKMGVISTFTREIAEHSTPAIEALIKQWMQEDTSVSLDAILLDATAATTTRPAGIRNGVAAITATAGGAFAALVADLKALTGALMTATSGNVRNPVWLMNNAQALSISLTQNAGGDFPFKQEIGQNMFAGYPVIVSGNVTAGMVILLDAADFAVIEAGAPRFDVSDQAVLHMEDTTPLAIGTAGSPATVAAP